MLDVVEVEKDRRGGVAAAQSDHGFEPVDDDKTGAGVEMILKLPEHAGPGVAVPRVLVGKVGEAADIIVPERGLAFVPGQGLGVDGLTPKRGLAEAIGLADRCRDVQHVDVIDAGGQRAEGRADATVHAVAIMVRFGGQEGGENGGSHAGWVRRADRSIVKT